MLKESFSGQGRFIAATIFLFLATQEVSGLSALRSLAEVLLLIAALREALTGTCEWRRSLNNPIYLTALLFAASALFSCTYSPLPLVSFDEMKMPVLKGMLAIPIALSIAVLGLVRSGWDEERIARLLIISLAFSGLGQLVWVISSYINYFREFSTFPIDPFFHRYKVGAALIAFPFVLLAIRGSTRFWALSMGIVAMGLLIVILTSNSRGAWLGVVASIVYLYFANRRSGHRAFKPDARILFVAAAGICVVLLVLAGTPMVQQLESKVMAGFDTSNRFGHGVWGATLDMIRQEPWLGYGYGDEVYALAYNALAPSHPEWIVRESIGSHNAILANWVATGAIGMLAIFLLYGGFLLGARRLFRERGKNPFVHDLLHAVIAALISYYLVRGQFEIVRWNSYGILMAVLLWLFALSNAKRRDTERG